jgi:hypothetical protein
LTVDGTPAAMVTPDVIANIELPENMSPGGLADRLAAMPDEVAGLTRRRVQTGADNATVIYLAGEESAQPQYGLVVALVVPERDDADAVVAELQQTRWGDPATHTVTVSSRGDADTPAFREFWRTFPPGLFAIPNQPVYFLIFYRANTQYAFMVIAASPAIRASLTMALSEAL